MQLDDNDKATLAEMRGNMVRALLDLNVEPKLAENFAGMLAEMGFRAAQLSTAFEWAAALLLLHMAKPPATNMQAIHDVVALQAITTNMLIKELEITMEPRLMTVLRAVAEKRWDDLHPAVVALAKKGE